MPELPFKTMMNVGNPERAFAFQRLPNAGVGLARLEFIINNTIRIHPKALLNLEDNDSETRTLIKRRIGGYTDPVGFYVQKLVEGIDCVSLNPDSVVETWLFLAGRKT